MLVLSSTDLMALFDLKSAGTLTKWKTLGAGQASVGRNKWDARKFLEWWLSTIYDGTTGGEVDGSLAEARREYWTAKAERERMAADREKGDLMPTTAIHEQWAQRVRAVAAGLNAMPDRLPPLIVGKSRHEIRAILQKEFDELREIYARSGRSCPEVDAKDGTKEA